MFSKKTSTEDQADVSGKVVPIAKHLPSGEVNAVARKSWLERLESNVENWLFRVTDRVRERVQTGRQNVTIAGMQRRFPWWVSMLFYGMFRPPTMPSVDIQRIREVAVQGRLVYVLYCRSTLDYLYCNFMMKRYGLPLAEFANGVDLTWFMPLGRAFRGVLAQVAFYYRKWTIPDPMTAQTVEQFVGAGKPVLFFLTRSRSLFSSGYGFRHDPFASLCKLQQRDSTPIYIAPVSIVWQRHPETLKERTAFEIVFGDPNSPGVVRKTVHFLRYFRRAQVKFGSPIDLKEFLEKQDTSIGAERLARRIRWTLRHALDRERIAVTGPRERNRQRMMTRILRHREVEDAIANWARVHQRTISEGREVARKYLRELVPDRRWGAIQIMDRILSAVWKVFYDGVITSEDQLKRLRESAKDHPVVFVASHKSHIDYLVASWVLYRHEMLMPYICAGINLSFWPLGPIFRAGGAYFIRRSYPENELYPVVLHRFVRELLITGQSQLFFIEGGRSRTGKLLRPKLGILSKILEGYRSGACKDVMMVPVSIHYDRILEERSYTAEAKGEEKAKENLSGLLRFLQRMVRSRYGKIYVHWDEPVSLADYTAKAEESEVLERLASRICFGINRVSVVQPVALASLLLLSHRKRGLSREKLHAMSRPLISYLEHRKVRFTDAFENRDTAMQSALEMLSGAKLIHAQIDEDLSFYSIDESKRLLVNYYKNNIVHFFVTFSLLAASVVARARRVGEKDPVLLSDVVRDYEFLRNLFDHEFYFRPKESLGAYILDVFGFFAAEGDLTLEGEEIRLTSKGKAALDAYREIAYNFLESYAIALAVVARNRGRTIEEKEILREALRYGRRMFLQGRLERTESINRFVLDNALHSFAYRGLLRRPERIPGIGREKGVYMIVDDAAILDSWRKPLTFLMDHELPE